MQEGSRVTYRARPDWGIGIVEWAPPGDVMLVAFEIPIKARTPGSSTYRELDDAVVTQPMLPVPGKLSAWVYWGYRKGRPRP
jgi:hypothetical protein